MIRSENHFNSFGEAYLRLLTDLLNFGELVPGVVDPNSIATNFGMDIRKTKELLVYSFCVNNPRNRYVNIKHREVKKNFALANFLWMLTASANGKAIIPFNKKGALFLNENDEINSAIGPHIFRSENFKYIELERIENLLRKDPSTRRAVIQLFKQQDLNANSKDIPCYNHIQFFSRKNRLICHVVMRSQSALLVLPYDFFLFSMLHEALSLRLGYKIGPIFFTANSLHIYEDEFELATKVVEDGYSNEENPPMLQFNNDTIKSLNTFFNDFSGSFEANQGVEVLNNLKKYNLDSYWTHMIHEYFSGKIPLSPI